MRSGLLRNVVELQEFADVTDSFGGKTRTMANSYRRKCAARGLTGREVERFGHVYSESTFRFQFRKDPVTRLITNLWRIMHAGKTYKVVHSFDPDGRNRELVVFANVVQ